MQQPKDKKRIRLSSPMITFNFIKDGEDGEPGKDGLDGKTGPSLIYAGEWKSDVTYIKDDMIHHYVYQWRNGKKEFYLLNIPSSTGDDPYINNTLGSGNIWRRIEQHDLILARKIQADEIDVDSIFAKRIKTGNLDVTEGATIGSFEVGNGRIGTKIDDPTSASFGNLAIYKDFFRVGGSNGYVMCGDNVIPASTGGAFTATGRIVNKRTNKGSSWGYDTSNYGLFLDVTGGTKNYGLSSNAPLKAPAFINTAVGIIDFVGSSTTYSIDFSQHSIFLMYADRKVYVDLPSESRVADYFSLRTLPNDFGFIFYVIARDGSYSIILKNIYDPIKKQKHYDLTAGRSVPILVTKSPTFRYQALVTL